MDAAAALLALGGAARWAALRRRGVTAYSLQTGVQRGVVVRVGPGAYALTTADAGLAAIRAGGVLAGPSAAAHHGLPLLAPPPRPVVAVPPTRSRPLTAGVQPVRLRLRPDEVAGIATSLLRTVVDCARLLPLRDAVVVADAALHAGLSRDELHEAARAARGPRSARIRLVEALSDARAESLPETCARLAVLGLGMTVDLQVVIAGVGRVDLVLDGWLVIEVDGFAFHSDRVTYRRDRRRWSRLVSLGYGVLVVAYEDAVHDPDGLRALVADTAAVPSRRVRPTS